MKVRLGANPLANKPVIYDRNCERERERERMISGNCQY